jgi:hypothetical protein
MEIRNDNLDIRNEWDESKTGKIWGHTITTTGVASLPTTCRARSVVSATDSTSRTLTSDVSNLAALVALSTAATTTTEAATAGAKAAAGLLLDGSLIAITR